MDQSKTRVVKSCKTPKSLARIAPSGAAARAIPGAGGRCRACLPSLAREREREQSMKHSFADVNLRLGYTLRLYKSVNMELFGLPKSHPRIAAFDPQFRGIRDMPFFMFRLAKIVA